ncbi:MAG: hypothetical protein HC945_00950 [Nitrosarchaeum sp.]|nr:hypothetical protein [Nitrosarchaeum sp.]
MNTMIINNESFLYLLFIIGLVGLAYGVRLMVILEHRILAMERRHIESDQRIEQLLLKMEKTEKSIEKLLYKRT